MNKKLTIIFSSIVLLGLASCSHSTDTTSQVNVDAPATAQEVAVESEPVAASSYDDFSTAPFAYREYNGQDLSNLSWPTVLFFSQESCGTCQKTDADVKAQESLPDDVSILKVDFDTELWLNQQYGVTTKHTFVLVDANGNEIAKELGLATADDIANFVVENSTDDTAAASIEASAPVAAVVATAAVAQVKDTSAADKAAATQAANAKAAADKAAADKAAADKAAADKAAADKAAADKAAVAQEETVAETPVVASSGWTYKDFSGSVPGDSVLFFHAKWCPSCVAADRNFKWESSLSINSDIIKVDYDSNAELKKKYGVTSQHTFVRVDANGNLVKKITGGSRSSDLQGLFN